MITPIMKCDMKLLIQSNLNGEAVEICVWILDFTHT